MAERLDREGCPEAGRDGALGLESGEDLRVPGGRGDDGDVSVVLGRRPDEGGPADVDLLDETVEVEPRPCQRLGERIEVRDDELERGDARLDELAAVLGPPPVGKEAAVDPRVERLHPAVEHLGETGDRRDVGHRQARVAERPGGVAGRDELEAEPVEARGEVGQAGLIGGGQADSAGRGEVRRCRVEGRPAARPRSRRPEQVHGPGRADADRLDPGHEGRLVVVRLDARPPARIDRRRGSVDEVIAPVTVEPLARCRGPRRNAGRSEARGVLTIRPRNASADAGPTSRR